MPFWWTNESPCLHHNFEDTAVVAGPRIRLMDDGRVQSEFLVTCNGSTLGFLMSTVHRWDQKHRYRSIKPIVGCFGSRDVLTSRVIQMSQLLQFDWWWSVLMMFHCKKECKKGVEPSLMLIPKG